MSKEGGVVGEGRGAEELSVLLSAKINCVRQCSKEGLPVAVGCASASFDRDVREICDSHGVRHLGLEIGEILQDGWIDLFFGVCVLIGDCLGPLRSDYVGVDDRSVVIATRTGGIGKILKCLQLGRDGCPWVGDEAAPELTLFEGLEVEASHDAEIIGPALHGFEEVRIGLRVGVDYLS